MKVVSLAARLYERRYGCFTSNSPVLDYFTHIFVGKRVETLKLNYFHVKLHKEFIGGCFVDRTPL